MPTLTKAGPHSGSCTAEVDLVDRDRLAAEVEGDAAALGHHLAGFEGRGLFLSDTDKDHAIVDLGVHPLLGRDLVFTLATLEVDQWHPNLNGERLHGLDETVVQRTEQRW